MKSSNQRFREWYISYLEDCDGKYDDREFEEDLKENIQAFMDLFVPDWQQVKYEEDMKFQRWYYGD